MIDIQVQNRPQNEWIDTREAVMNAIIDQAGRDERIVVLDADVTKSTRSRVFREHYPDRHFNVGIAELHMASMAAAMAADGMQPYICSFATFLALRALEPLRTQIVYPHLPAVMLGGYAGLSAMQHGPTHQCVVDFAIYNALPGVTVLSPSDSSSAADLAVQAGQTGAPVYMRIGYAKQRILYAPGQIKIGECYRLRKGGDVLLLSTGLSTNEALDAAELLAQKGVEATVVDLPTIKPFPAEDIAELAGQFRHIFTVEEHVALGGLYSQTLAALNEKGVYTHIHGINLGDSFAESAPYAVLKAAYGFDAAGIAARVSDELN